MPGGVGSAHDRRAMRRTCLGLVKAIGPIQLSCQPASSVVTGTIRRLSDGGRSRTARRFFSAVFTSDNRSTRSRSNC